MSNGTEENSLSYMAICVSYCELSKSYAHFYFIICIFILNCMSFLYILDTQNLLYIRIVNILSQFVVCLFIYLMEPSEE